MNQCIKYALTVVVTAAAMVAYQYEGKPEQVELAQQAPTQVPEIKNDTVQVEQAIRRETTTNQTELSSADLADIDPASIDWLLLREERGHGQFDPMIRSEFINFVSSFEFSDQEIAAYNKLHVIPFRSVLENHCQDPVPAHEVITDEDGACEIIWSGEEPFSSVGIDDLAEYAYNDAVAAAVMSRRSTDIDDQYIWALRAIALSGKSGPALWLAEHKHDSTITNQYVDGENISAPLYDDILRRYSLERLAFDLKDPRARPDEYAEIIVNSFGTDAEAARAYAESQVKIYKEEIEKIRTDLSLSTVIWRDSNA
jgi:hypothetical protein